MPDHAVSAHPAVQAQLDRLAALSPGVDVLGLDRITALLARLGDPHRYLPPVLHVAGTNGKGSTCAFLRAALEAAGHRVHVYTSPHLVRFNERIRLAGTLIDDAALAALLAEVLEQAGGIGASFFEVTTAAAFLAFARTPADTCVVEVGLGGRLDATNVLAAPLVCGIASLGIDHEAFLLAEEPGTPSEPIARIAFEKAGIAKPGVPLVTQAYPSLTVGAITAVAHARDAPLMMRDVTWRAITAGNTLRYTDQRHAVDLPLPMLDGEHQADNAALAVAMLRHQVVLDVPDDALAQGITAARWPARLQRLGPGPLTRSNPGAAPIWLDGGHNADAGQRLAAFFGNRSGPLSLVIGMLASKDPGAILGPLAQALGARLTQIRTVIVPGHESHTHSAFAVVAERFDRPVEPAGDVSTAIKELTGPVLVAGSLYLAGEVLRSNDEHPH